MSLMKKLDKINSVFHRGSDRNNNNAQPGNNKDLHHIGNSSISSGNSAAGSSLFSGAVDRRLHVSPTSPENDANLQKRLDVMGRSLARLSRKITRYINNAQQANNTDTNEKRLAKMNENSLAVNFREECQQLESVVGERSAASNAHSVGSEFGVCLAAVLKSCEDCYRFIAEHRLSADQKVEKVTLNRLDAIAAELANCEAERKKLEKLQKELASDENKLQQVEKSLAASMNNAGMASTPAATAGTMGNLVYNVGSGFGSATAQALGAQQQQLQPSALESKVVSMRNDVDDKRAKVEQQRDFLMANMYTLLSREKEISKLFAQLLKFTADYHEQALKVIYATLPEIEGTLSRHSCSPCYGVDLEQHLNLSGRDIALPIEACIYTLVKCGGLSEEGLFRVAGSASKTRKLKAALDAGVIDMTEYRNDFAVLGDALKSYLRELPNPLLNFQFYNDWIAAGQVKGGADDNSRRNAVGIVLRKLPETYRRNLLYLTAFLARLSDEAASNKMNITNLAIVVGPNLLWPPKTVNSLNTSNDASFSDGSVGRVSGAAAAAAASSEAYLECMQDAGNIHNVVECLIRNSEYFSTPDDGDIDFTIQTSDAVYLPGEVITPSAAAAEVAVAPTNAAVADTVQQQRLYPPLHQPTSLGGPNFAPTPTITPRSVRGASSGGSSTADQQQQQVSASRNNNLDFAQAVSDTLPYDPVALPPTGVHFTPDQQKHYADSADNTNNTVRNVSSFRKPTAIPSSNTVEQQQPQLQSGSNNAALNDKRHPPYYNLPPSNNNFAGTSAQLKNFADSKLPPVSGNNNNVVSDESTSPKIPRRSTTFRKSRPAPPPPSVSNEVAAGSQRIANVSLSPQQQPPSRSHHHHQRNASAGNVPVVIRPSPPVVPAAPLPQPSRPKEVPPRAYAEDDDIFTDTSSGHSSGGYRQQLSPVFSTLNVMDQTDGGSNRTDGAARDSSMDYYYDAQAAGSVTPPSPTPNISQQQQPENSNAHRFQHQQSSVSLNSVDSVKSQQRPPQRPPAPHTASRTRSPIVEVQPIVLSPATPVQPGASSRYTYNESPAAVGPTAAAPRDEYAATQQQEQPPTPKSLYPSDIVAEAYKSYLPNAGTATNTGSFQQRQQQQQPSTPPYSAARPGVDSYVGAYHQVRRPPPHVQNQRSFHVEQERRQKSSPPRSASAHRGSTEEEPANVPDDADSIKNHDAVLDPVKTSDTSVPASFTSSLSRVLTNNLTQRAASSCSTANDSRQRETDGDEQKPAHLGLAPITTLRNGSSHRSSSSHAIDKSSNNLSNGGDSVIKPRILPKPAHLSTTTTSSVSSSISSSSGGGRAGSTSSTGSGDSCRSDVLVSSQTSATTPVSSSGLPEAMV